MHLEVRSRQGTRWTQKWALVLLITQFYAAYLTAEPATSPKLTQATNGGAAAGITNNIKLKDNSTSVSSNNSNSNSNNTQSVDDLLNETLSLLDNLDQRVSKIQNKTPSALMRDNLRQLDDTPAGDKFDDGSAIEFRNLDEASIEEALVRDLTKARNPSLELGSEQLAETETQSESMGKLQHQKRGRQLNQPAGHSQHSLASDSTDRHIKFTLDLMQAIFASQGYSSSKSNQLESFLISPFSVQMVLMLMQLGSRGQTRREINQCLHLASNQDLDGAALPPALASSPTDQSDSIAVSPPQLHYYSNTAESMSQQAPTTTTTTTSGNNKLKRRQGIIHQQHQNLNQQQQQQQQQQQSSYRSSQSLIPRTTRQQPASANADVAHELFGAALKNLLKDQSVGRSLTSANKVFLQKNLSLASHYEWAIKHYYSTDIKQVDFQAQAGTEATNPTPSQSNGNNSNLASVSSQHQKSTNYQNNSLTNQGQLSGGTGSSGSSEQSVQALINDWVERQTKGKISNFLTSPVPSSTLLMALNVLFFKGDWQYKFDPADTEPDAWFTRANGKTVKVPMMVNRLPLAYAHNAQMKTTVIELPYKAQRLGLFVFLPDEPSGIFKTMQMLNSTSFAMLIASMRKPPSGQDAATSGINVRLPKFSIESSPRLSQILMQQMGLKSLFSPDLADLSAMLATDPATSQLLVAQKTNNKSPSAGNNSSISAINESNQSAAQDGILPAAPGRISLDELLHKAILQIDENGSVAAASSATIVERVGLFNGNYFEADHPFMMFLMDKQTGLVLFSGVYAGPASQESADPAPSVSSASAENPDGQLS